MAQSKKKRNKPYRGEDAASKAPTVHRYTAVQRSTLGQWWSEKKRFIKIVAIVAAVVIIIVWLIVELVRLVVA